MKNFKPRKWDTVSALGYSSFFLSPINIISTISFGNLNFKIEISVNLCGFVSSGNFEVDTVYAKIRALLQCQLLSL